MANEWYRKSTWTKEDEEDFFTRFKRARKGFHQLQYLRMQAHTLLKQNDDTLLDGALMLLDRFFQDYTDKEGDFFRSECLSMLGEIYERKKMYDKAAEFYEKGADAEKEPASIQHGANIDFARFVVIHNLEEQFYKAESGLIEKYDNNLFPIQKYEVNLLLAIFERRKGDMEKSLHYIKIADEAAEAAQSGFTYHQGLGLVSQRDIELEKLLEKIINEGFRK